ncbi:glycosyltransferase family 4 protein [Cytophagaceae bacterium YF14B1]|uniref:Glycosyltransferase family 4 protein n=1 Tax=Xanthocytophaga flava TaxID=3048013 RepID=A0AAE3QVI3_9BACT|nr:glycosyltransferase family 4 protein [Xanthocytophaga flavus]MDJ1484061.1 glycosyltransferase family 4 protein [Xanthocytophaga flavus]
MKIAQIAPLYESVPPKLYGGTERVVSYLTEELIRQGHEVTLFATGDSNTSARLVSHIDEALRLNPGIQDPIAHHIIQMQDVMERAEEFDILHFHNDYLHFPFSATLGKPCITTLHGRLDLPDLQYVYNKFKDRPLVSISDSQRKPLKDVCWAGTVYHGLPLDLYNKGEGKGDYVAFIGRISPEKRPDRAIEIARKAGIKIKMAAKIDKADQPYYQKHIRKLMDQPHVEFIGEIGEAQKGEFLGNAKALLFPIDWPEPFGMVMIEAMACGTPVIAFNNGSVPEIIDHGESGFVVNTIGQAVKALNKIDLLDRKLVRKTFENRFSAGIMAESYLHLFERMIPTKRRRIYMSTEMEKILNAYKTKQAS